MGDSDDVDPIRDELLRLERALAERRASDLPGGYEAVIHEVFHETGASGRSWTRQATLAALEGADVADVEITRFEIESLAPGVVLATYEVGGSRPARRASLWVLEGGRWQIRFHQGTLR